MGKLIAILGIAVVGFLAAVVGMLAVSGNLNKGALDRMLGRESATPTETVPMDDPSGTLVKELKLERERLAQRRKELDEWEEKLILRGQEDDTVLTETQALQEQINASMDALDEAQAANLESLSKTLASMNPKEAAIAIAAMAPEDAVKVLPLMKDRNRGKIMDAMKGDGDQEKRNEIFELMQEKLY